MEVLQWGHSFRLACHPGLARTLHLLLNGPKRCHCRLSGVCLGKDVASASSASFIFCLGAIHSVMARLRELTKTSRATFGEFRYVIWLLGVHFSCGSNTHISLWSQPLLECRPSWLLLVISLLCLITGKTGEPAPPQEHVKTGLLRPDVVIPPVPEAGKPPHGSSSVLYKFKRFGCPQRISCSRLNLGSWCPGSWFPSEVDWRVNAAAVRL